MRKQKEQARQSDSEDDDIPFSELTEKVRAESQVSVIEQEKVSQEEDKMIRLFSAREANDVTMFGEVVLLSDEDTLTEASMTQHGQSLKANPWTSSNKAPESDEDGVPIVKQFIEAKRQTHYVGMKVARDFGNDGIFIGEVVQLEYDSDDVGREAPFYVVEYTDGDREDMDEEEFCYAKEFYGTFDASDINKLCDKQDDEVSQEASSGEEESYHASKKVLLISTLTN